MAEIWPRLKKKLAGDGKRKKKRGKSKTKANPYAASGLEKFAALLEGIQAKRGASFVERTASSLSAARSISRSAATLARSASRRSSESKPLQCGALEALALRPPPALSIAGDWERGVENSSEERQPQESHSHEVISSVPVGVRLPERTNRCRAMKKARSLHQRSKSAFVVLVAIGTFISSRLGKAGKPWAAMLTFRAVIQTWHERKVSGRFMFSSVALYFLTPLRSYLCNRMPTRLNLLPRALKVTSSTTEEESRSSEIVVALRDCSLGFPATPLASSGAGVESAPLAILVPVPESSGAPSASRRLAKKISSRLKKLKMFKSSSSASPSTLSVSEGSHHSDAIAEPNCPTHLSRASSPERRRMCPFSRRLHKTKASDDVIELAQGEDSSSRKCIIMRRQRSSDSMLCKKAKLGRMLSSETLEEYNLSESVPSSASSSSHGRSTSSSLTNVEEASSSGNGPSRDDVSWPVVGLLVTLLFLLVGRFPAIMATSLFFVVVSNTHHDRAHSRGRGREDRALEAARKLQRSPPPRGQRWAATSPRRRL